MICTIHGILCKTDVTTNKDGTQTPIAYVFSGEETVKIRDLTIDKSYIGAQVDIPCEYVIREFEGRKYTSIKAVTA